VILAEGIFAGTLRPPRSVAHASGQTPRITVFVWSNLDHRGWCAAGSKRCGPTVGKALQKSYLAAQTGITARIGLPTRRDSTSDRLPATSRIARAAIDQLLASGANFRCSATRSTVPRKNRSNRFGQEVLRAQSA